MVTVTDRTTAVLNDTFDGPKGEEILTDATKRIWTLKPPAVATAGSAVERQVTTANRDQTVVFGDLHFMCPSSGGSSLQMRRGSAPSMAVTQFATFWSTQQGAASEQTPNFTISTSWRKFRFSTNLNLTQHNNYQTGSFNCNGWHYEISVYVGLSWTSNRFVCTRWRLAGIKGGDGDNGRGIVSSHRSDGVTAIGGNVYTLDHVVYEYSDATFQDMGLLVAPPSGIQSVLLGSYDGAHTASRTFTLAGGRTWQDVLDEFQFVYVLVGENSLFSHDQTRQFHVEDLGVQSIDMAVTDYQTHGSNAYHYKMRCPASNSTTVTIDNDGSNMTVQRIRVRGVK